MSRRLDDWLTAWCAYMKDVESPELYKEWVGVSVIAGALQRKCFLKWGVFLTFYPNMYIVLVGPPGCRKGTVMGPGNRLLRNLGIKVAAESVTREALCRELMEASASDTDEKTGTLIMHASLTIYSEELAVFLGQNNLQLMSDLTDWFDCRDRWVYRTKNKGTDDITGVFVNLIGATTPSLVSSALPLDAIGGGLTSRMVFVYADKKSKIVPLPIFSEDLEKLWAMLEADLEHIHMLKGQFRVTQQFLELWVEWYEAQAVKKAIQDPRFDGYLERRATHLLKLSMILCASRVDGNMIVKDTDLRRGIDMLERVEKPMAQTFGGVGKNEAVDITNKIIQYLVVSKKVRRSELLSKYYYDVDGEVLDRVIDTLRKMGAIKTVMAKGDIMITWVPPEERAKSSTQE